MTGNGSGEALATPAFLPCSGDSRSFRPLLIFRLTCLRLGNDNLERVDSGRVKMHRVGSWGRAGLPQRISGGFVHERACGY